MCSQFVRFVVKINKNPDLFITDFNSEWTKENVRLSKNLDSMVFMSGFNKYIYSESVLHLMSEIHWVFKPLLLFKVIPKRLRDEGYKFVARNRGRLFKSGACERPSDKFKSMYLS